MGTKEKLKQNKAITLVALVITVIIMILLAGISIYSLTDQGLFGKAKLAKLENKRASVSEWLTLKVTETQTDYADKNGVTEQEVINSIHDKVNHEKDGLKESGVKKIDVGDVKEEENFEKTDPYFYVIADNDLYKVNKNGGKLVGPTKEQKPATKIAEATNTSNSITVKVDTEKNEGGKIEYYIKGKDEDDSKYKLIKTKNNDDDDGKEFTFEGLEDNKEYTIKVVVIGKNGKKTETIINKMTKEVTSLTKENITFECNPTSNWTNKDVTITAKINANVNTEGFTIRTSKDGESWTDSASQTFTSNGTMYVVLFDGVNYGGSATTEVTNIDKTAPTDSKPTIIKVESKTISVQCNQTDNGGSGISSYYYSNDNGTNWIKSSSSKYTFTGLKGGTTYNIKTKLTDIAGNETISETVQIKTATSVVYGTSIQNSYGNLYTTKYPKTVPNYTKYTYNYGNTDRVIEIIGECSGKTLLNKDQKNGREGINGNGAVEVHNFTTPVTNQWMTIEFYACAYTYNTSLSNLKIKFNTYGDLTLQEAVNKKLIEPLVLCTSSGSDSNGYKGSDLCWQTAMNTITGGNSGTSKFNSCSYAFKVKENVVATGIQFTSTATVWYYHTTGYDITHYGDGLQMYKFPAEWEISTQPLE